MSNSLSDALIFGSLLTVFLLYYGISGFLSAEIDIPLAFRLFYVIRIPYGRIRLAGASATVASLGCLIPGILLGLLILGAALNKINVSGGILLGMSFVAVLVAGFGMMLAFFVKIITGR